MNEELTSDLPHPASEDCDAPEFISLQDIEIDKIRKQANYKENWSELFYKRLLHPDTVRKYVESRLLREKIGEVDSDYNTIEAEYLENISKVFNHTNIGNADTYKDKFGEGSMPQNKGLGEYGEPGTVFSDAVTHDGNPMNPNQKSIIEAHEQAHGVLDKMSEDQKTFLISMVDDYYISNYKTRTEAAQEILAKITQIKNYFGMKGNEVITEYHLDYASKHYVDDTNLDNSIGALFKAIKPEKRKNFVAFMNTVAC